MKHTTPPSVSVSPAETEVELRHTVNEPVIRKSSTRYKVLIAFGIFFGLVGIGLASATWWYQYNFNAGNFKPVQLSLTEQQEVEKKLATLENPEEVSDPAKTIVINEREINGYLQQQGLGETVKVHINQSGIGATVLAPVDESVPWIGGTTLRLKIAFNTKMDENKRFALSLADVRVGGISLPNAWLGNLKGVNLLDHQSDFGGNPSLNAFAAGIKSLSMRNGEIRIMLND